MNEEDSPYRAPRTVAEPATPPPVVEPAAIKVFGILHLVLAGLGLLNGTWGIVGSALSSRFAGLGMPEGPETEGIVRSQQAYMSEITWVGVLNGVFSLVLAVLLLVAGIKLLKRRPDALSWSNGYAWSSIGFKVVGVLIAVLVVLPASNRMMDQMMGDMPGGAEGFATGMKVGTSLASVVGAVLSMTYPILALVLLNREPVKNFLAAKR